MVSRGCTMEQQEDTPQEPDSYVCSKERKLCDYCGRREAVVEQYDPEDGIVQLCEHCARIK